MRRLCAVLLLVSLTASAQQQQQEQAAAQIYVTLMNVLVDVRDKDGNLPSGLTAADFVVLEDGVERKVVAASYLARNERASEAVPQTESAPAPAVAAEPAPRPWQLVLYFETQLSSGRTRKIVTEQLAAQADALAALGRVDVILADPSPQPLLRDSRDPERIRVALATVASRNGPNRLALHRRDFLSDMQSLTSLAALRGRVRTTDAARQSMTLSPKGSPSTPSSPQTGYMESPTQVTMTKIRPFVMEEVQLINVFRQNLVGWLESYRQHSPRTLLLVTDGFDTDPLEFYRESLADSGGLNTFEELTRLNDDIKSAAKALAAAGWRTLTIPGDGSADTGWLDDASVSAIGRVHRAVTTPEQASVSKHLILHRPTEPLQSIADETGGALVANSGKIAAAIDSIDDRIELTYQVDRKPDGKPHRVEVRARDANLRARSGQWVSSSTPDQLAEVRAIRLLTTDMGGDFPVETTMEWDTASTKKSGAMRVAVTLDGVRPFLPAGRPKFRVTMAVLLPPNKAFAVNSVLSSYELTGDTLVFRAPISVPAGASVIVIAIEEMVTGLWGSSRIEVPRQGTNL